MQQYLTILLYFLLNSVQVGAQDYKKEVIDIQIACGFAGITSTSVNNISQFVAGKAYSFLKVKLFSQNKLEALLSCIAVKELKARELIRLSPTELKQLNTITNWDCNYYVCYTCTGHFTGSVNELLTKENQAYQLIKSAIFKSDDVLEIPVKSKIKNLIIEPFEASILNSDYSMAYSTLTILTNKELKVVFKGELEGEKDSVLFSMPIEPSDTLEQISNINLDSLKEYYSNSCIADGLQISVVFKKNGIKKMVHLSNFYQEDIGKIIYLINSLVPDKYKVHYNKEKLLADYIWCHGNSR